MDCRETVTRPFIRPWQRLSYFFFFFATSLTAWGQHEFVTTWQTTDGTITIPTTGGGYNYNIYWEEIGNEGGNNGTATGITGNHTITGLNTNQYRVKITGQFPRIYFNNGGDKNKILAVEQWGNISWSSMQAAFFGCANLTIPATDAPDLSVVTSLENMFNAATSINHDIGHWDVKNITTMKGMFMNTSFNQDISSWDVSHVTNMYAMFYNTPFNQSIGNWNVANVTDMSLIFGRAESFNQDIGHWDVSNVTAMEQMFDRATSFNQDIGNWDVSNVTSMNYMFFDASSFDQNIGNWDVTMVSIMFSMLSNSGLSKENYDLTLIGWASQNVLTGVSMGASGLKYCSGKSARNTLISGKGWTITGDGEECLPFITTWQTTDGTITIPTTGTGYNYDIYWEEVGNVGNNGSATGVTGNYTINGLNSTSQYRIKISGDFPRIYFNNGVEKNKILTVEQWGNIAWTDMANAFFGCSNLTVPAADAPNLSGVTYLGDMFRNAASLTVDHIALWDVSHVTNMGVMFWNATAFNQDIGNWDVSNVTNMGGMFSGASAFNQDIGNWDVSNVTNMNTMFSNATAFNQHIGDWDVSNVSNMIGMFQHATSFNQDIGDWNVGNVTTMGIMFQGASSFDQDISSWNVGNVTNMGGMFWGATAFNQNIGTWHVSKVTDMNLMFENAVSFNQNLGNWDVTMVSNMANMLNNSGLSSENYHLALAGWASQNVKTNVPLGAQGLEYSANDAGRKTLRSKYWTITGDICTNCSFITTWQTTDGTITIPTIGGGYNYNIYWEDTSDAAINGSATGITGNYTINGLNTNRYRVTITGQFPRIFFDNGGDRNKILTVEQWGDIAWTNMAYAFFGCSNLTIPAADAPDLSGVTSMGDMFRSATSLTVDNINLWDVSNVTNMGVMFWNASSFNQDIGNWDVGNVTNMGGMFMGATSFNQDLGNWDVSKVVGMNEMFRDATSFNGDISNWNVGNVGNMTSMFSGATSFDQAIGNWNVGNVTNMGAMFLGAASFNQDVSSWNVGNVTNMGAMFLGAASFNQDVSNWNVSNVTSMGSMFRGATTFNQDIGNWNVSNVTDMVSMFWGATAFDQNIGNWNVSNVTSMANMFYVATSFNQDIGNWNVSQVRGMAYMFQGATSFNQDISNWNVGNVTDMRGTFWDATSFNQDISNWNVGSVVFISDMFRNATAFDQNIGSWDISKVSTLAGMFDNSALSRENYELTLTGWASQNVLNDVALGASGLNYCSETARNTLISGKGWTITGDTKLCSQTITFNALPTYIYGDIFTLSATASSGLPVTFTSSDPSIASIAGNTVTVLGTGSITITATQSGDENNEAANSEQQSLTINPKPVTITVDAGHTKIYGETDPVFTYSVHPPLINGDNFTGSLARTAGETTGTHAINQSTLTAGTHYTITFVGNDLTIAPKAITVTATSGQTKTYGEADPTLTYSVDPDLISGDAFTGMLARATGEIAGTYPINIGTLDAGSNYEIAFVGTHFHILKLDQTITFDPLPDKSYGDDPFTIVATTSSSLPISFTSSDESIAIISGDVVTLTGSGSVIITAIQEGNEIYNPLQVSQTLEINPANVFIPTFFSPDGNGINDTFLVHGADIEEIQLIVFDRLGKEVFRTTDVHVATQQGWDGKKQGEDQPAGTYSWVLKGKRNGNPLSFQGKSYGQIVLMR